MLAQFEWIARSATVPGMVLPALYASYGLALWFVPSAGLALRGTATTAIGIWIGTVGFHLLSAMQLFSLPAACVLVGSVALAVHFGMRGRGGVIAPLRADVGTAWDRIRPRRDRPWATATSVAILIAAGGFVARAASVPVLSWDSLTYHAVKAGLWVQGGAPIDLIAPGGWSIYRTYLGGGEALIAWAMLPFHADTLGGLADAAIWLLLGGAVYALAVEAGLPRRTRIVTALYVMALPAVARTVGSLYIDNTLALLLIAAYALALHAVRKDSLRAGALALATLGSAAGVKVFAAPVAALLTVALVLLLLHRSRSATGLAWLTGGGIAAAAAAGPWLLRTWQLTGFPLSPLPIRVGPFTLGATNAAMRWYMQRPQLDGAGALEELGALGKMIGLPGLVEPIEPTLGMFVIVPVLLAIPALVILARRRPLDALLFTLFIAPMLLSFYGAGLRNTRLIWAAVSGRYLIAAVAAMVVLAATPLRGRARTAYGVVLGVGAVVHFFVNDLHAWRTNDFLVAAVIVAIVGGTGLIGARWATDARRRAALALALTMGLVTGLHVYRERNHERALRDTTVLHALPRYWAKAAARVDDPAAPRTVAVTAGPWQDADNWLLYPFLGRRLQNRLIYVSPVPDAPLIDMERYGAEVAAADYRSWHSKLIERGVTEVISFAPGSIELSWMQQRPRQFERLEGDGRSWGLYSVREGNNER